MMGTWIRGGADEGRRVRLLVALSEVTGDDGRRMDMVVAGQT
jgi:hypothetical protein